MSDGNSSASEKRPRRSYQFLIDRQTKAHIAEIVSSGGMAYAAPAIRTSVRVYATLIRLRTQGFAQLVVRNPKTREERIVEVG